MNTDSKIYFTIDSEYLDRTIVAIHQLEYSGRQVVIIDCGKEAIPDNKKKAFQKTFRNLSFFRLDPKDNIFYSLPEECFPYMYPPIVCVRLLLPYLFPEEDFGLFLDSDIFIREDINEIFKYRLKEDEYVGGVCDIGRTTIGEAWIEKCNISEYINAGILLMNFSLFRENRIIFDEMVDYIKENKPQFPDQDAINQILVGKKRMLPLKWNVSIYACERFGMGWANDKKNVAIYHYCGDPYDHKPHVPWNADENVCKAPFGRLWRAIHLNAKERVEKFVDKDSKS